MKVQDIMTEDPKYCGPDTSLAAATELMWNHDCGALPVVDGGKLVGIITDRDICIALGTRNQPAGGMAVKDVASRELETCTPDDNVHTAMGIMSRARVRRLPVVRDGEILVGIIAMNDIVLAASRKHGAVDYEETMNTIKAISEHRVQKPVEPAELTTPSTSVAVA